MPEWVRVKDKETGHEYSVPADQVVDGLDLLDKPGADRFGDPLPAKPNRPLASITDSSGTPVDHMTIPQLREFAGKREIDLGEASLKDDILAAVVAHEQGEPAN